MFPTDITLVTEFKAVIQYNTFIDLNTDAAVASAFGIYAKGSVYWQGCDILKNYFYSENIAQTIAIFVDPTDIDVPFKINYNRVFHNSIPGAAITFGEGTAGAMDGTEIIGNLCSGYLKTNEYNEAAATHGILVNGGKDFIVKYNKIINHALGMAFKANAGEQYTSGGIFYNIFYNNSAHFYIRRAGLVPVYGNTFVNADSITTQRVGAIDDQTGPAGCARGSVFTNNIFHSNGVSNKLMFAIQDSTLLEGTDDPDFNDNIWDYDNTIKAIVDSVDSDPTYTYDEAVTNGWINNGEQAHPVYTDKANGILTLEAGSAGIGDGTDLGAALDDGLDATTDWNETPDGEVDNFPTIVTKQQGATWDKGAYVS